jgi:hypothetical protein
VSLKLEEDYFGPAGTVSMLEAMDLNRVWLPLLNGGFGPTLFGAAINPASLIGYSTSPFDESGESLLGYQINELRVPGQARQRLLDRKKSYFEWARADTLAHRTYDLYPGSAPALSYSKTALVLRTIENHFGWPAMQQALKTYCQRFQFKHPTGRDFLGVLEESLGPNVKPFLDQLFLGRGTVDFAVAELRSKAVPAAKGFSVQSKPGEAVTFSVPPAAKDAATFESEVLVQNLGEVELPVDVRFTFEGGETITETWDGRGWKRFQFGPGTDHPTLTRELVQAEVDPERRFAIDLDVNNNGRRNKPSRATVVSLGSWITFWLQSYLAGLAFFW